MIVCQTEKHLTSAHNAQAPQFYRTCISDWVLVALNAELDTGIAMNWIDVNDKLPETGIDSVYGSVWVLVSYVFDGKHYNTLGKYIKTPAPYWIDVHRDKLEKITHWMPLPEPPSIVRGVDPFEFDLLTKV